MSLRSHLRGSIGGDLDADTLRDKDRVPSPGPRVTGSPDPRWKLELSKCKDCLQNWRKQQE